MSRIKDKLRLKYLWFVAKLRRIFSSAIIKWLFSIDITFIFLFLALILFGYNWTWQTLLGAFGLWFVAKEIFKHIKEVARETRQK